MKASSAPKIIVSWRSQAKMARLLTLVFCGLGLALLVRLYSDPSGVDRSRALASGAVIAGAALVAFWKQAQLATIPTCPNKGCAKKIRIALPWTCESCHKPQKTNRSLLSACQHCRKRPNALLCPHCGQAIVIV